MTRVEHKEGLLLAQSRLEGAQDSLAALAIKITNQDTRGIIYAAIESLSVHVFECAEELDVLADEGDCDHE